MTIKEMEERSGLQRSNIRFYERSGLLNPQIQSNKYREYSQNDLDELMRIKLLRGLGVSVEQIKQLQSGKLRLADVMENRICETETEAEDARYTSNLCRIILKDSVSYDDLDGVMYLNYIPREETYLKPPEIGNETVGVIKMTAKRIFARLFDMTVYNAIWVFVFEIININRYKLPDLSYIRLSKWFYFRSSIINREMTEFALVFLTMLIIEPLLLHFFGATLGKWIFGLRVKSRNGTKLDYIASLKRTFGVIFYGYGLGIIPIVTLACILRCVFYLFKAQSMEWDLTLWSEVSPRKTNIYNGIVFVAVLAIINIVPNVILTAKCTPPNRGELTVAEFAENFNYLSEVKYKEFFAKNDVTPMNEFGAWTAGSRYPLGRISWLQMPGEFYDITMPYKMEPHCSYIVGDEGEITKVEFNAILSGEISSSVYNFKELILTMVQAYVNTDEEMSPFSSESRRIERLIRSVEPFDSFIFTVNDTLIIFEVEYSGYTQSDNYLDANFFKCKLIMEREVK